MHLPGDWQPGFVPQPGGSAATKTDRFCRLPRQLQDSLWVDCPSQGSLLGPLGKTQKSVKNAFVKNESSQSVVVSSFNLIKPMQ